jgi:peptide/nickel transport system permease protein/oligopeptide transport system permease protein
VASYLGQRIAVLVPVVLLVFSAVFAILHVLPGDPVQLMLAGAESGVTTPERIAQLRKSMGLDLPLHVQYVRFIADAFRGDLGQSIRFQAPVNDLVETAARQTLALSLAGMVAALAIGIPLGILAGLHENAWVDTACMLVALLGVSMPLFWLGLLLILFVSIHLHWLPAISGEQLKGIVLPALTLGFVSAGIISRLMRASLIDALRNDYVRTAMAKGLPRGVVAAKHALRNALIPVITIAGLQFGGMLSGAVITETVFSRPGLGSLIVKAILWHDYPLIQGAVLLTSVSYVVVNLGIDVLYAWIDPRIRYA